MTTKTDDIDRIEHAAQYAYRTLRRRAGQVLPWWRIKPPSPYLRGIQTPDIIEVLRAMEDVEVQGEGDYFHGWQLRYVGDSPLESKSRKTFTRQELVERAAQVTYRKLQRRSGETLSWREAKPHYRYVRAITTEEIFEALRAMGGIEIEGNPRGWRLCHKVSP